MDPIEELSTRIAGEISLSKKPSITMRKWRDLFGVTQSELANYLGTTPSVVCDYESGRRSSPGSKVIRKFVGAFIQADSDRGHPFLKSYKKSMAPDSGSDVILDMREFNTPITALDLCSKIKGEIAAGREYQNNLVYGYTAIDSIKAILELSSDEFPKIYGTTPQRALIFTKVSYGRSPLIAVRVSSVKPKVIVMHDVKNLDKLGEEIARLERLPIILTSTDLGEMLRRLRGISS